MAWTAPRSWTPGELVTATMMQAQISDNFNAFSAQAWTWSSLQTFSNGWVMNAGVFSVTSPGTHTIGPVTGVTGLKVRGADSGSNGGAFFGVTNNAANVLFMGNRSSVIGAGYDATATIFAPSGPLAIAAGGFGETQRFDFNFFAIKATHRIYIDGVAGAGDTYAHEPGANMYDIVSGGTVGASFQSGMVFFPNIGTTGSAANAFLDAGSSEQLLRSTSSIRNKRDVQPISLGDAQRWVLGLRAITYRSTCKADMRDQRPWVGFIAEEVSLVAPMLVAWSEPGLEGDEQNVTYDRITAPLVTVVQDLMSRVHKLEGRAN